MESRLQYIDLDLPAWFPPDLQAQYRPGVLLKPCREPLQVLVVQSRTRVNPPSEFPDVTEEEVALGESRDMVNGSEEIMVSRMAMEPLEGFPMPPRELQKDIKDFLASLGGQMPAIDIPPHAAFALGPDVDAR